MRYFVFALLVFCGLFEYGSPIMCYECNSATNSQCLQNILPESLKRNCSEHDRGVTHTLCRKIVQDVDVAVNGQLPASRVIRSCGWDESRYKVCDVTHTLCRKIVQPVDAAVNGQLPASRVIRSCGWDESVYKGACYHRSGYGGRQEVCSCTKDLCNGASSLAPILVLALSSAVMAILTIACQ